MKKTLIACCLSLSLGLWAHAQSYKAPVPSGVTKVEIVISNTHLNIEGYDGNEILITVKGKRVSDRRADGLRALNQNGVDNTGTGIHLEQSNDKIRLLKVSKKQEGDFSIQIPQSLDLVIKEEEWQGEEVMITGMAGAIKVYSNNSDIVLKQVTGPIHAKTTSGDISASFSKQAKIQASEISSVSGTVDVYLPKNLPADLDISSISGEVYSDFDLDYERKKNPYGLEKIGGGKNTKATINGGGIKLVFSSISDDVYVRKAGD